MVNGRAGIAVFAITKHGNGVAALQKYKEARIDPVSMDVLHALCQSKNSNIEFKKLS